VSSLRTVLPDADRAVVGGEFGEDLAAGMQEALQKGVDGWLDDDLAFTKPWRFSLEEISIPTMLWHATADLMVPVNHGQWLSSRLARASVHVEPDEGHLSLASRNFGWMLDELVVAGL
jgi:pimeloyl-ACP methyl ester carboxylesterase